MRITRLQLHYFGRHHDLDVEMAPGFTIIRGPNEAGKSTIQRGLELALFRRSTATSAELEALRSWGAAEDHRSTIRLEFVMDEESAPAGMSGPGVLEKEFRGQKGRVSLDVGGKTHTDPGKVEEVIADLTGIPNEAFFRSTASIRHEELDNLDRDEGALRDRLQASIGGGDKGSSRARARLEEAIRALKTAGAKNPGRLKIADEAVNRAQVALRTGEAALKKLEKDRDDLAQARDARLRTETGLSESRNMLEAARQAERLRSDRAVVGEKFERYRQAAEAQQRLTDLEAMPERSMSGLREQLDRMRTLQSRVNILQETLQEDAGPEIEPDEPEQSFTGTAAMAGLALAGAALAILFGITAPLIPVILLGLLLLGLAAYLGLLTNERRALAMTARSHNQARDRERTLRRQGRVGTEEGLRVATSGVANILREMGVRDVGEAEKLLINEQARRQEIATLQVQVAALLAGQSPATVVELRDKAALDMEQKAAALSALGPIANDARARERLEAEVRDRQAALERGRDAEAGAMARVEANAVDAEQVAGEAERLVTWEAQLAALKRRLRIYEQTLAAIEASESGTMKKATRFLEQQVARDLGRLTGGRYRRVSIDDQTLDITVWAPERNDWVAAYQLSKGTVDQVFLAARIGLVRLVTQGRRPPLVLDDPFVTFDDKRAARAAVLLRELSSDFQVIYLACSDRYDGLADAVVELPGPSEIDAPTAEPAKVSAAPEPEPMPEPAAVAPEFQPAPQPEAAAAPAPEPTPEPDPAPQPAPEPGLQPEAAAPPETEPAPEPAAPEPAAATEPEPTPEPDPAPEPTPGLAPEPSPQPEAAAPDHDPVIAVEAPGALLFAQAEVISFGEALQVPLKSDAAPDPDDAPDAAPEVGSR
jgi:DNA repair exonuclease SbcCD ATPase subunit